MRPPPCFTRVLLCQVTPKDNGCRLSLTPHLGPSSYQSAYLPGHFGSAVGCFLSSFQLAVLGTTHPQLSGLEQHLVCGLVLPGQSCAGVADGLLVWLHSASSQAVLGHRDCWASLSPCHLRFPPWALLPRCLSMVSPAVVVPQLLHPVISSCGCSTLK